MSRMSAPRRTSVGRAPAAAFAAVFVVGPLTAGLPSAVAATSPNLVISQATVDRTTVAEGDTVNVTFTVRNKGSKKAGRSHTRFYLTRDWAVSLAARKAGRTNPRSAPEDIRLVGEAGAKAVRPGKSLAPRTVELTVPVGTQPGSYTVIACADDKGKVKEKNEADNCTPAGTPLKVNPPEGNDDLVVQAFADTAPWPEDESSNLQFMKIFCSSTYPVQPKTFAGALASTRAFLTDSVGADAMEQLAESGQADTAVAAQSLAAVAVTEGVPGLALASLMRAHELEPRNAGHLVNMAAVATSVGLPNEALAFLDASVSRDLRVPALGVSQHAIGLTVRGQALLLLGKVAAAEAMFQAAKLAEPMLSEADAGLANVEACKDNDPKAIRFIRKSHQRSQEKDTTPTKDPVRPAPALDLSLGVVTPLRQLPMAETPSQAVDMRPVYKAIRDGMQAAQLARIDETNAIEQHLNETDELRTWAEKQRRDDIMSLVHAVGSEPDLAAMRQTIRDKVDVITEHREEFWGGGTGEVSYVYQELADAAHEACIGEEDYDACWIAELNDSCIPEFFGYHNDWRAMISELQNLSNDYFALTSERMSAYASNLLDEEAHRLALLAIEAQEEAVYGTIVQQAQLWTHSANLHVDECIDWQPLPVEDPAGATGAQSKGECPKAIKAMNYVAILGPSKVKVNCEKVTQEISKEVLPLLHVFGEIEFSFQTGRFTVFVGSKGEGRLGVVEGGFKSGIYLTSERNGDIFDVGWRVGPSVSVVGGAAEFQPIEDMEDISFIGRNTTGN